MHLDRLLPAVVVLGVLLARSPGLFAAPDPEAADAAFDAGDTARALALYDEILEADPGDMNALLRSGKLLSWERRYEEALSRYDRALTREPGNVPVLLERGKVLLWSKRYDEAVTAFSLVLQANPNDPWALCGTAQAYAWRGRGPEARPYYERALAAQPGMKEAMLGLAYIDLGDGDTTKALERSNALNATDPKDPEVVQLAKDVRRARDKEAADAAFDAGDTARALALYDEILEADPGDMNALLRSGKLLSWERRYEEALSRYDRALTREPANVPVLLERGKVLLWSKRYDEAVTAFSLVLRANPNDPWALCGTAQAYAWRGRSREARPYYERALAAQPGMKEAMLGLAYIDLGDGDTTKALERSNALNATDPNDPEVVQLGKDVRRARAPWVQVGWDGNRDSDGNVMAAYRAEGGLALPARLDLKLGTAHTGVHGPVPGNPDASGDADALYAVLGWQPRPGHRGELRLGGTQLSDSTGNERTTGIGGLLYSFPMVGWTGRAAIAHDPFLYSPQILDNEIDVTSLTFGASGLAVPRARIETNVGYGDFSDGNARRSADAGAWYVMSWPKRTLLCGGVVRYLGYTDDLANGYFDPSTLIAALISVRSDGSIGSSPWQYEAAVEAGAQWFTLHDVETSHEPLWNLTGLVSRPFPHGLSLQFFATFGNSSAASGPGFTSRSGGLRLRYTIGG